MEERDFLTEFQRNARYGDITCESGCDYTLPDYKSDVRKVLFTNAEVCQSGKYLDGDELSCSGIVNYKIIYLDSEGKIEGADFSSDYDFVAKIQTDSYEDSSVDTRLSNLSVRLTGPRRFSVKSSLSSAITLLERASVGMSGDVIEKGESIETATANISVARKRFFKSAEREYAEKICQYDGLIADDVRIIHTSSSVKVENVYLSDGGAVVKGGISVCCLVQHGEMPPHTETCTIQFEERVDADVIDSEGCVNAEAEVTSLRVEVNPEEFGCALTADVIMELSVSVEDNTEVGIVKDAYTLACASVNEQAIFSYDEHAATVREGFALELSVGREELGLSDAREIIFVNATPKLESAEVRDGCLRLLGEVRLSGIASEMNADGEICYVNFKTALPFDKNVKYSGHNCEKTAVECKISAYDAGVLFDKDNAVLSCEVVACATVRSKKCVDYVSDMSITDEEVAKAPSRITVYYPDSDDTLFGIAKKFRTTVKDIAVDNSLTESVVNSFSDSGALKGVRRLIIK